MWKLLETPLLLFQFASRFRVMFYDSTEISFVTCFIFLPFLSSLPVFIHIYLRFCFFYPSVSVVAASCLHPPLLSFFTQTLSLQIADDGVQVKLVDTLGNQQDVITISPNEDGSYHRIFQTNKWKKWLASQQKEAQEENIARHMDKTPEKRR